MTNMDTTALKNHAAALARSGNWGDEAVRVNNQIIELDPSCSEAYTRLAKIWADRGDHYSAHHMYEAVLELEPQNRIAQNGIQRTHAIAGDSSVAERLNQIGSVDQLFSLATKFKHADPQAAAAAYRRIIAAPPDTNQLQYARTALAAVYRHLGVRSEAEKLYREILAQDSQDNEAKVGLAAVLGDLEHYHEAIQLCREVLNQHPSHPYARKCLGGIYAKKGESDLADKYFA